MSTIRRYDSRKLYDPTASRYVSLDEIAARIRRGEEIEVLDNATGENVTALTLMQIILDEGKSGRGRLPSEMLHDLVRVSGEKVSTGVGQVQTTMNRLMRAGYGSNAIFKLLRSWKVEVPVEVAYEPEGYELPEF